MRITASIFLIALSTFLNAAAATTVTVPGVWPNIQGAIDFLAIVGDTGDTVEVLPGTYTGEWNRDLDFRGMAITVRSTDPTNPAVVAATIIDCGGSISETHRAFYFHSGEGPDSVVAGFTITNGSVAEHSDDNGSAIKCSNASSPTISNCVITGNGYYFYWQNGCGGAIHCTGDSHPIITHCTISNNGTYLGAAAIHCGGSVTVTQCTITGNESIWGWGAISCGGGSTISNCTITDNSDDNGGASILVRGNTTINNCTISGNVGGGVYCGDGNPIISHCNITGNYGESGCVMATGGGGVTCYSGSPTIEYCTITGNSSISFGGCEDETIEGNGGGIHCMNGSSPTIRNCTISGNSADDNGGGVYCEGGSSPTIMNCILWGNTAPGGPEISGAPEVLYSDINGGYSGIGNIDVNPLFADQNNSDYHLKSEAGRWDPVSESWVNDEITSPCIDAGNPGCPVGDEPAPNGNRINMGAYGGTAEASKSPSNWALLADLTNDGIVDFVDLAVFFGYWPDSGQCVPADLNRSGSVDLLDYSILANQWPDAIVAEPQIQYEIAPCGLAAASFFAAEESLETRFTATVEGRYIHFEDMMRANCCATGLWLDMNVEDDLITIFEHESGGYCLCICDYPVTATFGPFEEGTYLLEVYEDWGGFIGSTIVTIGPGG